MLYDVVLVAAIRQRESAISIQCPCPPETPSQPSPHDTLLGCYKAPGCRVLCCLKRLPPMTLPSNPSCPHPWDTARGPGSKGLASKQALAACPQLRPLPSLSFFLQVPKSRLVTKSSFLHEAGSGVGWGRRSGDWQRASTLKHSSTGA